MSMSAGGGPGDPGLERVDPQPAVLAALIFQAPHHHGPGPRRQRPASMPSCASSQHATRLRFISANSQHARCRFLSANNPCRAALADDKGRELSAPPHARTPHETGGACVWRIDPHRQGNLFAAPLVGFPPHAQRLIVGAPLLVLHCPVPRPQHGRVRPLGLPGHISRTAPLLLPPRPLAPTSPKCGASSISRAARTRGPTHMKLILQPQTLFCIAAIFSFSPNETFVFLSTFLIARC